MVRIFAAGDFHGDKQAARRLAERAVTEKADIIVLNGDIVEEDNPDGIVCYFARTGKPVILVPGNHDWFATDFLAAKYNIQNLHNKSMSVGNIAIVGSGSNMAMMSEKDIYEGIRRLKTAQKTLLVSHVHPSGTLMETFSQFVKGSVGLRKAIEATNPAVVLCGHVHEAEGIEEMIGNTLVVNVGKKGRLIEF
ncbi:3',5'-cyclic adenosine monophosphate phosphodiesterase CpdA [uncultured archaeon]|nr:3',5'-cyclic adenosine monophosphate phosphodiesterase CpdA [uncultured archaeon]